MELESDGRQDEGSSYGPKVVLGPAEAYDDEKLGPY